MGWWRSIKKFNKSSLNFNFKIVIIILITGVFFANPGNIIKLTLFNDEGFALYEAKHKGRNKTVKKIDNNYIDLYKKSNIEIEKLIKED